MGLRNEIQADIAEAFNDDLADAVGPFTLKQIVEGEYDPATGTAAKTEINHSGRGVFGRYRQDEIDGQHIVSTDIKLTVLQNELTDGSGKQSIPEIGFVLKRGDRNSWFFYFFKYSQFDEFRVLNVGQDPAGSCWFVQLRKA